MKLNLSPFKNGIFFFFDLLLNYSLVLMLKCYEFCVETDMGLGDIGNTVYPGTKLVCYFTT